jgi:hypothetical protein
VGSVFQSPFAVVERTGRSMSSLDGLGLMRMLVLIVDVMAGEPNIDTLLCMFMVSVIMMLESRGRE